MTDIVCPDKVFNNFKAYINKFRVNKENGGGTQITHTAFGRPEEGHLMGSFSIPDEEISTFHRWYGKMITKGVPMHFTERHIEHSPFLVDLDFKYVRSHKTNERIYNEALIKMIVSKYICYIKQFYDLTDEMGNCYVFEKPQPTVASEDEEGITYKDGFHLMFPNLISRPTVQYVVRLMVMNDLGSSGVLSHLGTINDIKDIFDEAVIYKNGWMMYGSRKPNGQLYSITKIYDSDMTELDIDDYVIDPNYFAEEISIRQRKPITPFAHNMSQDRIEAIYEKLCPRTQRKSQVGKPEDVRMAHFLVGLLNPNRNKDYKEWIELGFCLHNIDDSLLEDWIDFSKKSSKFKEGECEKLWKGFRDTGITIKSLHFWARKDNPGGYGDMLVREYDEVLKTALTGTSYDVARSFYELHKYDYVYCMKSWFFFNGNNWEEEKDTSRIIMELNQNMSDIFTKMAIAYGNKALGDTAEEKDRSLDRQKNATNISLRIRQSSFKKNIIEELTALYNHKKFIEYMDENRDLICFNNGVFDLKNLIFRQGIPDDNMTMSTGTNYTEYDPNEEYTKKVLDFFHQIMPEEDMRDYLLTLLSTCLSGHVPDEKIYIWTGSGGNGKSLCIQLTQLALGDYASVMPITLITNKRAASNAATPELAKIKGKRLAIFQEPDNNMQINAGLMKELTGNDKIQARALFKDPIEFFPQFKPILTCNRLPIIPSTDGGTWRRIRIIPFEMKFVDNPMEDYERKVDRSIKESLVLWKDAFLSILVEYYKRYKEHGLKEPEKVMEFTKQYERDNDKFKVFVDNIIKPEEKTNVSIDTVYKEFIKWYKANNNGAKTVPTKAEVRYEIEEKSRKRFDNNGELPNYTIRYFVGNDGEFKRDENIET
jgi:P4 family phage/plasmid primase-like protien